MKLSLVVLQFIICEISFLFAGRFYNIYGEFNKSTSVWTPKTFNKYNGTRKCFADSLSNQVAGPFDLGDKGIKTVCMFLHSEDNHNIQSVQKMYTYFKIFYLVFIINCNSL